MIPFRTVFVSILSAVVILAILVLSGLFGDRPLAVREALVMGTVVEIKAPIDVNGGPQKVNEAIDKAFDEMARVDGVFSAYKSDSEISCANRLKKDEKLRISDEAFGLIATALDYSVKTDGRFDITVKPLIDLWNRAKDSENVPSEEDVKRVLARVGYRHLLLDAGNSSISFAEDGMAIDLGGAAKGYAVDRAIKILAENGVKNAVVHAGGDMYCLGSRSKRNKWTIGIQHPRDKDSIFLKLKLSDKAVSTSGDYERFFILDGKRYSHIIDPLTGYPIGDRAVSASVIADDSMTADMLATALCAAGRDGLDEIGDVRIRDAIVITKDGGRFDIDMTEGFRERYGAKEKIKL